MKILFVDNDDAEQDVFRQLVEGEFSLIRPEIVGSCAEAERCIAEQFFDAAIVDLHLDGHIDGGYDGLHLLRLLAKAQPSCERIVFTNEFESSGVAREVVGPFSRLADRVVTKADRNNSLGLVLKELSAGFWSNRIILEGFEKVVDFANARYFRKKRRVEEVFAELEYLIARVVDPYGASLGEKAVQLTVRVNSVFGGGASHAIVFSVNCYWSSKDSTLERSSLLPAHSSGEFVFKLGQIQEVVAEVKSYTYFVAHTISEGRRVELLAHSTASVMGLLSYSVVANNTGLKGAVQDLSSIVNESDFVEIAQRVIDDLFSEMALHAVEFSPRAIVEYAKTRFVGKPEFAPENLRHLVHDLFVREMNKSNDFFADGLCCRGSNGFEFTFDGRMFGDGNHSAC